MAAIANILPIVLLLCIVTQGMSQCDTKDLKVAQTKTTLQVQSRPQFNVTVTNTCGCTQLDVKLTCKGFKTVEPVASAVLDSNCLFNLGNPVYARDSVSFTYAWDTQFPFSVESSEVACS